MLDFETKRSMNITLAKCIFNSFLLTTIAMHDKIKVF